MSDGGSMGVGGVGEWEGMGDWGGAKNQKITEFFFSRHFLRKIRIFNFFEFFSKNVFKSLPRRRETFRKKMKQILRNRQKTWFFWPQKKGLSSRVFLNQNFQNFKLKIGFFSNKKSDVTKLENCANSFVVNYIWKNFERNRRTFFSSTIRPSQSNLKSYFFPIKNVKSQNSKIAHIYLSWAISVRSLN